MNTNYDIYILIGLVAALLIVGIVESIRDRLRARRAWIEECRKADMRRRARHHYPRAQRPLQYPFHVSAGKPDVIVALRAA